MNANLQSKLKNKYNNLVLLILVSVVATSCVSIETTSYSDPDFTNKKYAKFCIYSVEQNLNRRALVERVFSDEFKDAGIYAVEGSNIFPPTRTWEEGDFQSQLIKNGFDGFIKIEIVDEKVNERITPQIHTNTETRTIKKKNGKDETVTQSNTYVTEDIDVYMNNQFQADLIDVTTNKVAWKGYSTTSAQVNMIGMDIETIIEKFAESVIEEMKAKGHIK
ncbi:MAG: hypothetical protein CVV25_01485 [Ignavibacteriae bacterium HGW-Ignavibacteriae-4]|jgi:hypothetical protein|nr:MAG: hypothetical protein CVV25_01485 [Ignavibacteriae bacterium HGW-Ignavibacteriae-4]